jgi:hypothetical protein
MSRTGCRGISCSKRFPGQLAVVPVPPPPGGNSGDGLHHKYHKQAQVDLGPWEVQLANTATALSSEGRSPITGRV